MGSIKKFTNKYTTPSHPWRLERIETESKLRKDYGLKNTRELWKSATKLKNFKDQIKGFANMAPIQAAKQRSQLEGRLAKYGILPEDNNLEMVLGYSTQILLERRLQTIMVRKNFCRTMRQARQFITHRHVLVNGKIISAPGYLVPVAEENSITFKITSTLASEEHPERISKEDAARKREEEKEAKRILDKQREETEPEVIEVTEEDSE